MGGLQMPQILLIFKHRIHACQELAEDNNFQVELLIKLATKVLLIPPLNLRAPIKEGKVGNQDFEMDLSPPDSAWRSAQGKSEENGDISILKDTMKKRKLGYVDHQKEMLPPEVYRKDRQRSWWYVIKEIQDMTKECIWVHWNISHMLCSRLLENMPMPWEEG